MNMGPCVRVQKPVRTIPRQRLGMTAQEGRFVYAVAQEIREGGFPLGRETSCCSELVSKMEGEIDCNVGLAVAKAQEYLNDTGTPEGKRYSLTYDSGASAIRVRVKRRN